MRQANEHWISKLNTKLKSSNFKTGTILTSNYYFKMAATLFVDNESKVFSN